MIDGYSLYQPGFKSCSYGVYLFWFVVLPPVVVLLYCILLPHVDNYYQSCQCSWWLQEIDLFVTVATHTLSALAIEKMTILFATVPSFAKCTPGSLRVRAPWFEPTRCIWGVPCGTLAAGWPTAGASGWPCRSRWARRGAQAMPAFNVPCFP